VLRIVWLKPSRGAIPSGPDYGEGWHGIAQEHCVSRSVRDSAALLDATAGGDLGAPYAAPPPSRPFLARWGTTREAAHFVQRAVDAGARGGPDCAFAVHEAAEGPCASGWHTVKRPRRRWTAARSSTLTGARYRGDRAGIDDGARSSRPQPDASQFEPGTWFLRAGGRAHHRAELASAVHVMHAGARAGAVVRGPRRGGSRQRWRSRRCASGALQPRPLELAGLAVLRVAPSRLVLRKALDALAERAFEWAAFTAAGESERAAGR